MTDTIMQITFLPQDIDLIRKSLNSKDYSDTVSYDKDLKSIYINLSKVKDNVELCLRISDLIVDLMKEKDLKEYIWKTYTNIKENEKDNVYKEALDLFNKKQNFIKETVYNKVIDLIIENRDLNLEGFFKFRMKDFVSYISIISDIALEEYLIKRDKKEFLDSLKYFIDIQEEKMNLLRIVITNENKFVLSDENGNEVDNLNSKELMSLAEEENLSNEDLLISAIMTLCPQKIEIIDKCNTKKSRDTIDIVNLLFEGKVTIIYSN